MNKNIFILLLFLLGYTAESIKDDDHSACKTLYIETKVNDISREVVISNKVQERWSKFANMRMKVDKKSEKQVFEIKGQKDITKKITKVEIKNSDDRLLKLNYDIKINNDKSTSMYNYTDLTLEYKCEPSLNGRADLNATLYIEEPCQNIYFQWQKECGNDMNFNEGLAVSMQLKKLSINIVNYGKLANGMFDKNNDTKYSFSPSYKKAVFIFNTTNNTDVELGYPRVEYKQEDLLYPVLRGNASKGGILSPNKPLILNLEFNCLGKIEGDADLTLIIDLPYHIPAMFSFNKMCEKESIIEVIEERIDSSFPALFIIWALVIFILACLFLIAYRVFKHQRTFSDSIPLKYYMIAIYTKIKNLNSRQNYVPYEEASQNEPHNYANEDKSKNIEMKNKPKEYEIDGLDDDTEDLASFSKKSNHYGTL